MCQKDDAAVAPGTLDLLPDENVILMRRGFAMVDQSGVDVDNDTPKSPLFTIEERVDMARKVFASNNQVRVEPFSGLTVDFADDMGAKAILRGLRAVSDFEYEFQLALLNRKMKRHIQTVFLMTDFQWMYIS